MYLDGKVTDQRAAKDSSSMAPANSSSSLGGFNQFPFFDDITRPRSREGDAGGVGSGAVAYGRRKSETRGSANELSQG